MNITIEMKARIHMIELANPSGIELFPELILLIINNFIFQAMNLSKFSQLDVDLTWSMATLVKEHSIQEEWKVLFIIVLTVE